jgi:hypothetical protein
MYMFRPTFAVFRGNGLCVVECTVAETGFNAVLRLVRTVLLYFARHEEERPLGRSRRRLRMILKWIFKKWGGEHGLDRSGSG